MVSCVLSNVPFHSFRPGGPLASLAQPSASIGRCACHFLRRGGFPHRLAAAATVPTRRDNRPPPREELRPPRSPPEATCAVRGPTFGARRSTFRRAQVQRVINVCPAAFLRGAWSRSLRAEVLYLSSVFSLTALVARAGCCGAREGQKTQRSDTDGVRSHEKATAIKGKVALKIIPYFFTDLLCFFV